MTDEEKLAELTYRANLQASIDTATRSRDAYQAQINTLNASIQTMQARLDAHWKELGTQIGSGT